MDKITRRGSRWLSILVIALSLAAVRSAGLAQSDPGTKVVAASSLEQQANTDRQDAAALRSRANEWDAMRQKAQARAARSTDPLSRSVWEQTAQHHAEAARRLKKQAEDLERRANEESARAAADRSRTITSSSPPVPPMDSGRPALSAIPAPIAGASGQSQPPAVQGASGAEPSPQISPIAKAGPSAAPSNSKSDLDRGGCACPELPALPSDKPPVPGHVHDELSEADLEAMFSNRDLIFSGWGKGLNALAHEIDPGGAMKIWNGPAPKPVHGDITLKEGGESGLWVGHPLPRANSYAGGSRTELLARNPWSWQVTPETLAGAMLATLARTRKYGSPKYAFRQELLTISLFLGETLANGELPAGPIGLTRPSETPTPPVKSSDAERLEQGAAAMQKRAADARARLKGWENLLRGANDVLAKARDKVVKEVWTSTAQRYQDEVDRARKEVHDLEEAAAEKETQARVIRPTAAPAPLAPGELQRRWQAKGFGSRFQQDVINFYLNQVTPAAIRLARTRPHPPGVDPLTYGAYGKQTAGELPLDRFDMANAALDMILWHDDLEQRDTGWLTFNNNNLAQTLLQLAAAGPKFAAPGTVVSTQQAAIACKAFSTLVYLADSDAQTAEKFQRVMASFLFFYSPPENAAQADLSQVPLAARAAMMRTGIASSSLAQGMARTFLDELISTTRDQQNHVVPRLKQEHDNAIETAVMLASSSGGKKHPGSRNEFYYAIQNRIPELEARRASGSGSPEESDFLGKWKSAGSVTMVDTGSAGPPCR